MLAMTDTTALPNPFRDPALSAYLKSVSQAHGYMRFLAMPTMKEVPDTRIADLFVPTLLSSHIVDPERELSSWLPQCKSLFERLEHERRLILLGDPGSGKSTLLNWFAWRLASGLMRELPSWVDGALPLPLVLRELDLSKVNSFDALMAAFLARPVAKSLGGSLDALASWLEAGKVAFLLDGLDEVPQALRQQLNRAIHEGFVRHPSCIWLATSRIIGYDEFPLHRSAEARLAARSLQEKAVSSPGDDWSHALRLDLERSVENGPSAAGLAYVAPFDDERVEQFARNWYQLRDTFEASAATTADDFLAALRKDGAVWRLARTPNLLTLMALVYRIKANLPDGRFMLYEDIARAYLESIDQHRRIQSGKPDQFDWEQKKRWLARIAFEMQWHRGDKATKQSIGRDLLVSEQEVLGWLEWEIGQSQREDVAEYARDLLSWFGRRSGLLLPRGEGVYAFLHLSFVEYFCAIYLAEQMQWPQWEKALKQQPCPLGLDERVSPASLASWAGQQAWQEVYVFLFESLARKRGWTEALINYLWGKRFAKEAKQTAVTPKRKRPAFLLEPSVVLLARVLVDSHCEVALHAMEPAIESMVRAALAVPEWGASPLFKLASRSLSVWREILKHLRPHGWSQLVIDDVPLTVEHLQIIAEELPELEWLSISDTGLNSLAPLSGMQLLEHLDCANNAIASLSPLKLCKALRFLNISNTPLQDCETLNVLPALTSLGLNAALLSRVPTETKKRLTFLSLNGSHESVLGVELPQLRNLGLSLESSLSANVALPRANRLRSFSAFGANLPGLKLASFPELEMVTLMDCRQVDLANLELPESLRALMIYGADIDDLTPLSKLHRLTYLDISHTPIHDLTPLIPLVNLRQVKAEECPLSFDGAPLEWLRAERKRLAAAK
jgi:internalin A